MANNAFDDDTRSRLPASFGEASGATVAATGPVARQATPDATTDALVATLREQLADMRSQRDAWQAQAERLAIAGQPSPAPPMTWWRWLRSTG